ncbi:DUF1934 domain-containing protein [Ligilactobacillus saerimneri]|uniref:DUF1934 domain-containing protein n=1 Tax=Ligilactobacillus saerimneri TaxID=228229 RepID=UPI001C121471|nr:DUF1934 domain-containing protein [Ligilactobacillus saerimneri]MBU5310356.1 DUF1934 domain-containing protein [Ligilactobacillus saerimneri]
MEKYDVQVEITTRQETHDKQVENYHRKFAGQLVNKEEATYIRYREEDGTRVMFKLVTDDQVMLTRTTGQHRTALQFDTTATKVTNHYHTPYGMIELVTRTTRLDHVLDLTKQPQGHLAIDYRLYQGVSLLGEYKIRLQFKA